jgi:phosphatidate phosphatase
LDGTTCENVQNHHKYIQDFTCTNNALNWSLKNMRLSFPSGHSSFAFAVAIYCVIYMQTRITWRGSKLLKYFLQLIFIAAAAYTGFSRISDYKHHWEDVLGGSVLGIGIALVLSIYATDLFKAKKTILREENNHQI